MKIPASDPPVMQQVQVQARQTWGVSLKGLLSGPGAVEKGHHAWLGQQGDSALAPVGVLQGGMGKGLWARLRLPLSAVTGSPFLSPLQPNGIQSLCGCSIYVQCAELMKKQGGTVLIVLHASTCCIHCSMPGMQRVLLQRLAPGVAWPKCVCNQACLKNTTCVQLDMCTLGAFEA